MPTQNKTSFFLGNTKEVELSTEFQENKKPGVFTGKIVKCEFREPTGRTADNPAGNIVGDVYLQSNEGGLWYHKRLNYPSKFDPAKANDKDMPYGCGTKAISNSIGVIISHAKAAVVSAGKEYKGENNAADAIKAYQGLKAIGAELTFKVQTKAGNKYPDIEFIAQQGQSDVIPF